MDETLTRILSRMPADMKQNLTASDTTVDLLAAKIAAYNAAPGTGDCPDCRGKGYIAEARSGQMVVVECRCMTRRRSLSRIRRSGLGELFERYTLDSFTTERPWQRRLKDKALEYIERASGWFFVCGRSGSGKTHLTCAIARELLDAGMETRYFMWRQDAPRLKALVNDRGEYERRMTELTDCRLLLLDDLWKGGMVTEADVNLTFELLNARYNAPSKLTLISSEKTVADILRIDEAVGGRIVERARGFTLHTADENIRLS